VKLARSFFLLFVLATAAAVEVALLGPIGLPGATPPLVMILVLSASIRRTPNRAALVGFVAGIIVDAMPSSVTPLGVSAFAFALMAYVISNIRDLMIGSVGLPLIAAAVTGGLVPLVQQFQMSLIGADFSRSEPLLVVLITSALYAVMLSTIVLPALAWLEERFSPRNSSFVR
jgi:rod shape-determining protein MreD